jgi:hypothetical protein
MNDVTYEETTSEENDNITSHKSGNDLDMIDMSVILSQATEGNTKKPNT